MQQVTQIPSPRLPKTATEFLVDIQSSTREEREELFFSNLIDGYVPLHMRFLRSIKLSFVDAQGKGRLLEVHVMPDYLRVGTQDDSVIVPLWPLTAQRVADVWNCVLPTPKMVSMIWYAAKWKVPPSPWGPPYDHSMMSTSRIFMHNSRVTATMKTMGVTESGIVAGHKKDVVLTNRLVAKPDNVAIFGWHKTNGKPIQPLYLGHVNTYGDYSHGIRLILRECTMDGVTVDLTDVLRDPNVCDVLSDEGPLALVRQPGV